MADATTLGEVVEKGNELLNAVATAVENVPALTAQAAAPFVQQAQDAAQVASAEASTVAAGVQAIQTEAELRGAAADIAAGRSSVANGASFWVKPNSTDGLTRYTLFQRISATTQQTLGAWMSGAEFDAIFKTTGLSFRSLAPESGYVGGYFDNAGRAAWLVTLDGTFIPSKIALPQASYVSDDELTPLVERLLTRVGAEIMSRMGLLPPESGWAFALPGINGRSPLSIESESGRAFIPGLLVPNESVTLASLSEEVLARLDSVSVTWLGVMTAGALYAVNARTGNRVLVSPASASPHSATVLGGTVISWTDNEGQRYRDLVIGTVGPMVAERSVALFGNSETEGQGTGLAALIGMPVVNLGMSGWGVTDIAVRQGGIRPLLTVAGNTIPAAGPVTVIARVPDSGWRTGHVGPGSLYQWTGLLAGVLGVFAHDHEANTWTFTRSNPGEVVACPPGTPFICTDGAAYRALIQILMLGRNNVTSPTFLADTLAALAACIANLSPYVKEFLVCSILNTYAEGTDSDANGLTRYQAILATNQAIAQAYPDRFLDIQGDFVRRGPQIALANGWISAITADDLVAQTAGRPCLSLLAGDQFHPNAAGYKVIQFLQHEKFVQKGMLL